VARLATQTPGRVLDLVPLIEGPGPTSSPGSLPAPRVACRCSPTGFDRQHPSRPYKGRQGPPPNIYTPEAIQTTTRDVGYYALGGSNLSEFCVPCTFEFLILATSHLQLTTSGVSLSGLGGKTATAGALGRGDHRASTGELDGIFLLHQHHVR
jgi:hypothetical protein